MAKLSDKEDIQRMTRLARRRADLDIFQLILDRGRLCPTCSKPIKERGTPVRYYGEDFCSKCVESFRETEAQHVAQLTQSLRNL